MLEAIRRIDDAKEPTMSLFRLGGDEFAVLISNCDGDCCQDLEHKITEQNGTPKYDGKEYPVILRNWVGKAPDAASLRDLSAVLIHNVKNTWS